MDTVSGNIANVDTQGYTRKVQTQQSLIVQGQSFGVRTGNIEREVDEALQRAVLTEESKVSNLEVQEKYLNQIEMLHGDPDSESSLGNLMGKMSDGFTKLMDSPNSIPLQNQVVVLADTLARTLNGLSAGITTARSNVQDEIEDSLEVINTQLKTVDDLNRQIKASTALNRTEPEFEDKRDEAVRLIAQYVDVTIARGGDGAIAVLNSQGQPLIEDGYRPLSTVTSPITPQAAYPGSIAPIRQGDPASGKDITAQLTGGKLGGLIALRDQTLPRFQAQLDDLAKTLALEFSGAGLTLFTNSAGTVSPVPPATTYVGFSDQIQVSAAIKADPSRLRDGDSPPAATTGDSTLLRDIVDTVLGTPHDFASAPLPTSATLGSFATELVSYQTNLRASTTTQKETATSILDQMKTKLSDQSGVNIDQEISLLIQLQRSYSSSAQVVSANRQMFSELISVLR